MYKKILFFIFVIAVVLTVIVNISLDSEKIAFSDIELASIEVLATREGPDDLVCGILLGNTPWSLIEMWPEWLPSPIWDYMMGCHPEYVGELCSGASYNWYMGLSFCSES